MISKRGRIGIFYSSIILSLLLIASCSKPECEKTLDCPRRNCQLARCSQEKCFYEAQKNCCGNRLNESIEDGMKGGKCTCPQDYGKCEGKPKIKVGARWEDTAYLHYFCNEKQECILGIENKDLAVQNFLDQIDTYYFKMSSIPKFIKPFDVNSNQFEFRISLDEAHEELVFPVRVTKLKVLYSSQNARVEQLIADRDLDIFFNQVGDGALVNTFLNLQYRPKEYEELGSFRYSIDFTFEKKVPTGRTAQGEKTYAIEPDRVTYNSPSKPIFLVRSEAQDE